LTEGVILLNKPAGATSFAALGTLKRSLGTGRVGHTGTLDRFAEGLLVVLSGRMTRLCAFATTLDKEYLATVTFGQGTDTLDPEGTVTATGRVPERGELEASLGRFRGTISQVPPSFSAVHVNGVRAYKAARRGENPDLAPRTVTVTGLELLNFTPPQASLRVSCSKGTYIRSLARDIAGALGTCAFVSTLRRTRVGGFRVEDAVSPEVFDPHRHVLAPRSLFDSAPGLKIARLRPEWISRARQGTPVNSSSFEETPGKDGLYGAFDSRDDLVAVLERSAGAWKYCAVFPESRLS
jgi:tRNA pseudouridine55 synthase